MPINERSAEFWRGVLHGYHGSEFLRYEDIHEQIAAAEAREATQPTAAEVKLPKGKPNPCTCLGPDPCTCHGPTAAEVIEACRVALERCGPCEETITMPDILHGERLRVGALELCARWKEANG